RSLLPIVARLDALEAEFRNLPPARDGAPGKDADIGEILGVVDQRIAALAANPVDIELVDAKIDRSVDARLAAAVSAIEMPIPENGKDGVGLSGGFINHSGELVLTMSSGNIAVLDRVVGRDGEKGAVG